jgi:hypothetical protein
MRWQARSGGAHAMLNRGTAVLQRANGCMVQDAGSRSTAMLGWWSTASAQVT